ncbi:MAG: acetoin utilization protein AcuC [Gammaproteobacteria bacterium]|nr:acetoin utilization protein AcuC [Gammaproteobacteria bacterium]MDH5239390.1 acetoin utilization protein AcuC [Gammaproteobacteria bacterium]MDH5260524.1 acetoin utilization protein AcuC [Gammaproteobacteria bacterium]MDH5583252.1 acetoin utilization protein AcuC [Gammaproteobacteria bacterium]
MSDKVLVYKGTEIAAYGFGDPHPFGTDRHDVFHAELAEAGLNEMIEFGHPRPALVDELALFHTADYIDKVSRMSVAGKGWLDEGDTPAVPGIYDAAAAVVGAVLCAVDEIMHGNYKRAFVPIAGLHHAARNGAAGFCVFNDCGIAVEYLRKKFGLTRIAYVDIDAHHGDGVFYGFEEDPDLVFADIHEDGRHLYPGTGGAQETGKGRARGTKLNIPLPPGADDSDFHPAWRRVEEYIEAAKPEFILMQCGADSLEGDPITHLCWTEEAHATAAASLCRLADKHSAGRIIGTGGGGYNRRNLARAWTRVVQSFVETR